MRLLLDTQVFLWFVSGSPELRTNIKNLIEDENNQLFISIASLWEISIKTALKKLEINGDYATVIDDVTANDIELLPISFVHTVAQHQLPFHHRDPFDRIIVAQALVEQLHLVSSDDIFDQYLADKSVSRIWRY